MIPLYRRLRIRQEVRGLMEFNDALPVKSSEAWFGDMTYFRRRLNTGCSTPQKNSV